MDRIPAKSLYSTLQTHIHLLLKRITKIDRYFECKYSSFFKFSGSPHAKILDPNNNNNTRWCRKRRREATRMFIDS